MAEDVKWHTWVILAGKSDQCVFLPLSRKWFILYVETPERHYSLDLVVVMAFHEDSAAVGLMLWSMCVYSGSVFNVILKAALIWKVNLPSKQSKSLNSVLWSIWVFVVHQLNISQVFSKHLCNHRILTNDYSSLSLCVQQISM